jgi:hypothetical protein
MLPPARRIAAVPSAAGTPYRLPLVCRPSSSTVPLAVRRLSSAVRHRSAVPFAYYLPPAIRR